MNALLDLPESHQISILAHWLQLGDVSRLDSAICSRKFRSNFLDLLRSPQCNFHHIVVGFTTQHEDWALQKGLSFESAVLYSSLLTDDSLCASFFALTGPSLRKLHLAAEYGPSGDDFCDLSPLWPFLIDTVVRNCRQLTEFRVSSDLDKVVHDDASLTKLLASCTQLTSLRLENSKNLTNSLLHAISSAPSLQTLDLSGSYLYLRSAPDDMKSLSVKELNLNQTRIMNNNIHALYRMFPNLRRTQCTNLESADLVSMTALCPLLTHINVSVAETTYEDTVLMLADNVKHIESITIHYPPGRVCCENALLAFITHCPTLTKLDVFSSGEEIINRYNWLKRDKCVYPTGYMGSRLRELYLHCLFESVLCTILQQCPCLHILAIHHADPFTLQGGHLARLTPAEQALHHIGNSSIKVLYVHNYSTLDDNHIKYLCNLHELYISHVDGQLTSGGISALCKRCPDLRALYIKSCVHVTDAFVLPLLKTHPSLQLLELYCRGTRYGDDSPSAVMLTALVKSVYPNVKRFEINCRKW